MQAKILVLDDDVNILSAFEKFFRQEHLTMVAAASTEAAMQALQKQSIDLLITDVRLNWESGVTFFLKAKASYPQLPVIVITGYHESISEQELRAMGVDHFLLKPLDLEKLRSAVHDCLGKRTPPSNAKPSQPRFHKEGEL
jgi:two-component system, NtrC family, response regulator HydG